MRFLLLIYFIPIASCNLSYKDKEYKPMDAFTWSIQKAGYEFDHEDKMGETNYENFIIDFTNFPWLEQIEESNKKPTKCAPTLSVSDLMTERDLWVSMSGDKNEHGYLIGYIYQREKKNFFGFGSSRKVRWLKIYLTKDTELVKNCFYQFFEREYDKLDLRLSSLELYDEMISKDLAK